MHGKCSQNPFKGPLIISTVIRTGFRRYNQRKCVKAVSAQYNHAQVSAIYPTTRIFAQDCTIAAFAKSWHQREVCWGHVLCITHLCSISWGTGRYLQHQTETKGSTSHVNSAPEFWSTGTEFSTVVNNSTSPYKSLWPLWQTVRPSGWKHLQGLSDQISLYFIQGLVCAPQPVTHSTKSHAQRQFTAFPTIETIFLHDNLSPKSQEWTEGTALIPQ